MAEEKRAGSRNHPRCEYPKHSHEKKGKKFYLGPKYLKCSLNETLIYGAVVITLGCFIK